MSVASLGAVIAWAAQQDKPKFPSSAAGLVPIVVAVGVYLLAWLARGVRWSRVLGRAGIEHDPRDARNLVAIGYMGNTVLPARGGELLRIFLLPPRSSASRRQVIGSLVAERLLDAVALIGIFAFMVWTRVAGVSVGRTPAAIAVGVALVLAAGIPLYLRLRASGRLQRFADALRPFSRASRVLLGKAGLALLVLTVAVWLSEGLLFSLVGDALELDVGVLGGTFIIVLASFAAMIPAAPGFVGTFDGAVIFGLGALGVAGGQAVSFVLLVRFVMFVPITVLGLTLLMTKYGGVGVFGRVRDAT